MKLLRVLALFDVGDDQPLGLLGLKLQQPLLAKQVQLMEVGVQLPVRQLRRPLLPLYLFDKSEIISVKVARLPQSCPHL